jgi:GNAT superfamily N-acetyltransferase
MESERGAVADPNLSVPSVFSYEVLTSALWDEALPLIELNYRETGSGLIDSFSPNREWHLEQAAKGFVRCFTLRASGELKGYQLFFVYHNPELGGDITASQRSFYVLPELRGTTVPLRFLKYADQALENVDRVQHFFRQERAGGPYYRRLLEHEGYREVETSFVKTVKHGA